MSENEAIWKEIALLKEELKALRIKRELLSNHAIELKEMHARLKTEADRAERLAQQAEEIL